MTDSADHEFDTEAEAMVLAEGLISESPKPESRPRRLLSKLTGGRAGKAVSGAVSINSARLQQLASRVLRTTMIRGRSTLLAEFPGLGEGEIGQLLIDTAVKRSRAIGAIGNMPLPGKAAVLLPVKAVSQGIAVAVVEAKLIAELHELHGQPVSGHAAERTLEYLRIWVDLRDEGRPNAESTRHIGEQLLGKLRPKTLPHKETDE
ncbi:hypothetical protein AB0M43_07625 [Longispora sp. NPDC051575]|uniref:hypothetical protein n=1 Tax=Longispora sp. NPDC051575 TaxID=3154943 RepID=UPI00341ECE98